MRLGAFSRLGVLFGIIHCSESENFRANFIRLINLPVPGTLDQYVSKFVF